jgi:hypothetical protein
MTRMRQVLCRTAVQAGIDFDGHGVFALKGSKVRYMTAPADAKAKNAGHCSLEALTPAQVRGAGMKGGQLETS